MSDRTRPDRTALVIGGGVAGPVLAIALRRAGIAATVYEARDPAQNDEGSWLALMPNGSNALKTLGIDRVLAPAAIPVTGIVFGAGSGKRLGMLDRRRDTTRFGAGTVILKRGQLHRALRDEALRQGITITYGKRLTEIAAARDRVTAHFADGAAATGDLLIGCDGIHSRARQFVLPGAPAPAYTGITGFGGFSQPAPPLPYTGEMTMTFGHQAFFAYFATPGGEVYWFNNLAWPHEPARQELEAVSNGEWRQRFLDLHADDPAPFPDILRSTKGEIGTWVIHDLPPLPVWHRGPVCLTGDAAHATAPHAAQGASLALEDAVVLAKCLRDRPDHDAAFAAYQDLRKARVEKQARQARRTGGQNLTVNPVAIWLRDRLLPLFLRRGDAGTAWLYSYRVNWEECVAAQRR